MHPTAEQIQQALPHIRYEIESFLQTPPYNSRNEALRESVYFRKMAHCRALYHFFRKPVSKRQDGRKRVDDDVLSEDYGFQAKDVYGKDSATLLSRFNKDLLHLTYARLERTPETKPWPMDELFPPVEQRTREFIEHILSFGPDRIEPAEQGRWRKLRGDTRVKISLQQSTSNIAESIVSVIEKEAS
jgi:hypothetical protein